MMIYNLADYIGRGVIEYADRRTRAGQTLAANRSGVLTAVHDDGSFDVSFGGAVTTFPEPDRQFFDWSDDTINW
jgi:hypothetical protein